MNTARALIIAVLLLLFCYGMASIMQPMLTDMYFSRQPVMTLDESHKQTLIDGYGKVFVVDIPKYCDVEFVEDKINCIPSSNDRIAAGAWNPTYSASGLRQEDKFYVVWIVEGCK